MLRRTVILNFGLILYSQILSATKIDHEQTSHLKLNAQYNILATTLETKNLEETPDQLMLVRGRRGGGGGSRYRSKSSYRYKSYKTYKPRKAFNIKSKLEKIEANHSTADKRKKRGENNPTTQPAENKTEITENKATEQKAQPSTQASS